VLGNTPITYPIEWSKSKIPGYAVRATRTQLGHDNIFHAERYKWSARITVVNLMDKEALYNFLSTFSGTHYVTPGTVTATIGLHF
jgi:hypothetical protein